MYTHSSATSRKQHRYGVKHRENFQKYYEKVQEEKKRKFFEEHNLPLPPPGMPPPRLLFNFPPPALPVVAENAQKRLREGQ